MVTVVSGCCPRRQCAVRGPVGLLSGGGRVRVRRAAAGYVRPDIAGEADALDHRLDLLGGEAGSYLRAGAVDEWHGHAVGEPGGFRGALDQVAAPVGGVGRAGDVAELLQPVEHRGDAAGGQAHPRTECAGRALLLGQQEFQAAQIRLVGAQPGSEFAVVVVDRGLVVLHRRAEAIPDRIPTRRPSRRHRLNRSHRWPTRYPARDRTGHHLPLPVRQPGPTAARTSAPASVAEIRHTVRRPRAGPVGPPPVRIGWPGPTPSALQLCASLGDEG